MGNRLFSSNPRLLTTHLLAAALVFAGIARANPLGPQVVAGIASFNQSGNTLLINNSNNAILNWQQFSIAANEAVRFNQPSAASSVLNRVLGNDPSAIYGQLSSNGRVWLINPAGILVGPNARIDTAGFVGSTLNLRNEDFLAGKLTFGGNSNGGSVVNQGAITTPDGGSVYLIAPSVTNEGIITTPKGETILAAGQTIKLIDTATPGVNVEITGATGDASNLGSIVAEAGRIGVAGVLVKNSGTLNASSVVREGGKIFLKGTRKIELTDSSRIQADGTKGGSIVAKTEIGGQLSGEMIARGELSAQGDGSKGSGGFIETSGARIDVNGVGVKTKGGEWLLDPVDVTITTTGTDVGTGGTFSPASSVDVNTLNTALGNSNSVTINTAGGTGGNGDITVSSNITAANTATDVTLILKAHNDIVVSPGVSIAGTGSKKFNVTLNSDYDASGSGAIVLGTSASIASNGGSITLGGGVTPGTDYAQGNSTNVDGIKLNTGSSLTSAGGDISLRGKSFARTTPGTAFGVWTAGSIDSGTGSILVDGWAQGNGSGVNSQGIAVTGTISSAKANATAIELTGKNTASTDTVAVGVNLAGTVQTTGTQGGISISGAGGTSSQTSAADGLYFNNSPTANILASSGPISLTGTAGSGPSNYDIAMWGGNHIGKNGGTSSSNITLNANSLTLTGTDYLESTGTLTIQPRTAGTTIGIAGGAGSLSLPASYFSTNFVNGFAGFTIGSATAGAITVGGATTVGSNTELVNGSGGITISGSLTNSASGGTMTLKSGGDISVGSLLQSNAGVITVTANDSSGGAATGNGRILVGSSGGINSNYGAATGADIVLNGLRSNNGDYGISLSGPINAGTAGNITLNSTGAHSGIIENTGGSITGNALSILASQPVALDKSNAVSSVGIGSNGSGSASPSSLNFANVNPLTVTDSNLGGVTTISAPTLTINGDVSTWASGNISFTATSGDLNFNSGKKINYDKIGNLPTKTLTLSAASGNVNFNGTVWDADAAGDSLHVTITAGNQANIYGPMTTGYDIGYGDVNVTGSSITFSSAGDIAAGTGTINLTANGTGATTSIVSGTAIAGSNINLKSDKLSLNGTLNAGASGIVKLVPKTAATSIDLGSNVDSNAPLEISVAELGNVTAGTLQIGDANATNITVSQALTSGTSQALEHIGSGGLTLTSAGAINVSGVQISLAGGAFTSNSGSYSGTSGASITTAGGSEAAGGNVSITTTGNLTTQGISTNGGTTAVAAGKSGGGVTLHAGTGNVQVDGNIDTHGGAGYSTAVGGSGGAIDISSTSGTVTTTSLATTGGGGGSTGGIGGAINISSTGYTLTSGGSFNSSGGSGTTSGNSGTLTIAGPATLNGGVHSVGTLSLGAVTLAANTTFGTPVGSNMSFNSTIDGGYSLLLNTGGAVSFGGVVGGTTPLSSLTTTPIGGASGNISASNVNDRIHTTGAVSLTARGNIDIGGVITDGAAVTMDAQNSGNLIVREIVTTPTSVQGAGGAINLTSAGYMSLGGGHIDARKSVTGTDGNVTLSSGGAIAMQTGKTIYGNQLKMSAAGGIGDGATGAVSTQVSSLNDIQNTSNAAIKISNNGSLSIVDTGATGYGINQTGSGDISVTTLPAQTLSVGAPVITHGGTIAFSAGDQISLSAYSAGSPATGGGIFSNGGSVTLDVTGASGALSMPAGSLINSFNGDVTLNANNMAFTSGGTPSSISAGSGLVKLNPYDGTLAIEMGSSASDAAGTRLGLTDAELKTITTSGSLTVGKASNSGALTLAGALDLTGGGLTGGLSLNAGTTGFSVSNTITVPAALSLAGGGSITESGGITASSLSVTGAGGVTLNGSNNIGSFSASNSSSGNIVVNNSTGITLGTISNTAASGTLTVDAAGAITNSTSSPLSTVGGAVNLFASGSIALNSALTTGGGAFKVAGTGGAGNAASFTSGASGTVSTAGNSGLPGGNVDIATSGSIATQSITTAGGTASANGLAGGTVSMHAVDGQISTGTISTNGGYAADSGPSPHTGGAAGAVTVQVDSPTAARTISVGTISAKGGRGGNTPSVAAGGQGGSGGNVLISTTSNGSVSAAGIDTSGGDGGIGPSGAAGGAGATAGTITVRSFGSGNNTTVAGNLASAGGQGGSSDTTNGSGGAGGSFVVTSGLGSASMLAFNHSGGTPGSGSGSAGTAGSTAVSNSVSGPAGVSINAGSGGIKLSNVTVSNGGGAATGTISLTADRMAFGSGSVDAGSGTLWLKPGTANWLIDLGSLTDVASTTLELSAAELNTLSGTGVLRIGAMSAGNINLSGPVSFSNFNSGAISLESGGTITQSTSADILTAGKLAVKAYGDVTLDTAPNMVGQLSASVGNVSNINKNFLFKNGQSLVVGSVDGVNGVINNSFDNTTAPTTGGIASITTTAGTISQSAGATIGVKGINLSGYAGVNMPETNPTGLISGAATTGNFVYNTSSAISIGQVNGVSGISASSGMVKLTSSHASGVSQGASNPIAANSLVVNSAGSVGLDSATNAVGSLAGSITGTGSESFRFKNSGALYLDSISGVGGITIANLAGSYTAGTSNGVIELQSTGDITQSSLGGLQGAAVWANSTGGNVTLDIGNVTGVIAGSAYGSYSYASSNAIALSNVNGHSGITATNGSVTLAAASNSISGTAPIAAGSLTLTAGDGIDIVTSNATSINATNGTVGTPSTKGVAITSTSASNAALSVKVDQEIASPTATVTDIKVTHNGPISTSGTGIVSNTTGTNGGDIAISSTGPNASHLSKITVPASIPIKTFGTGSIKLEADEIQFYTANAVMADSTNGVVRLTPYAKTSASWQIAATCGSLPCYEVSSLQNISASTLYLGAPDGSVTGDLYINDSISFPSTVTGIGTGGFISRANGFGITANTLVLKAGSHIYLGETTQSVFNSVNALAATSTSGNITFKNDKSLSIPATISDPGGAYSAGILASAGSVSLLAPTAGNISLSGAVTAKTTAGGAVTIAAPSGSINGNGTITGYSLDASANSGIGHTTALVTQVGTLSAANSGANTSISIYNTGALTLGSVTNSGSGAISIDNIGAITTGSSAIQTDTGAITLTAHSPITVGSGGVISNSGAITLTAGSASSADNNDAITLNGPITTGGAVSLAAARTTGSGTVTGSTVTRNTTTTTTTSTTTTTTTTTTTAPPTTTTTTTTTTAPTTTTTSTTTTAAPTTTTTSTTTTAAPTTTTTSTTTTAAPTTTTTSTTTTAAPTTTTTSTTTTAAPTTTTTSTTTTAAPTTTTTSTTTTAAPTTTTTSTTTTAAPTTTTTSTTTTTTLAPSVVIQEAAAPVIQSVVTKETVSVTATVSKPASQGASPPAPSAPVPTVTTGNTNSLTLMNTNQTIGGTEGTFGGAATLTANQVTGNLGGTSGAGTPSTSGSSFSTAGSSSTTASGSSSTTSSTGGASSSGSGTASTGSSGNAAGTENANTSGSSEKSAAQKPADKPAESKSSDKPAGEEKKDEKDEKKKEEKKEEPAKKQEDKKPEKKPAVCS